MSRLKYYCFVLILNLIVFKVAAQPEAAKLRDTSFINPKYQSSIIQKGLKPYIVPTAMVGYGALSLFVPPLKNFNHSIQHQIVTHNPNFSTHADDYLWLAPTAALYGLNLIGVEGKHNFRDRTLIVLLSNGIMEVSSQVIKKSVREQRPDGGDYESFPSGHTASAFTAAEYLYQEYKDVSPWIGYGGYAVAASVGVLRMYNNHHYFGDVVAGAGLGIISTKVVYTIYPFVAKKLFKNYQFKTVAIPSVIQGTPGFTFAHHFN